MARKNKKSSLDSYLEEKKAKRIDAAQLTIIKASDRLKELKDDLHNITKTPKKKKIKKHPEEFIAPTVFDLGPVEEKKGFWKRAYDFVFGWVLTKKTDSENILQHAVRQFLPPDSSGKPSWQLFIVLWSLVLMSYVTATEIQVALSYVTTYSDKGTLLSKKMHGFSEAFIYFVIIFAGAVTTLFHRREKQRKDVDGTNIAPTPDEAQGGIISTIKDKIGGLIGKK